MKIAICIDYDNLSPLQKSAGILDVVQKTLLQASEMFLKSIGACEVRLYGGWYEGDNLSVLSQQLSVNIQNEFPALLRVPNDRGGVIILRTTTELAVSLLEEPGHQLFNTYRRKGRPSNIRVETPASVGCSTVTCPLPLAKKLLQKGSCPTQGCVTGGTSLVYRHEQKLVDTMLTCDLMYLANQAYDFIFILSADDDFLPPIRTLLLRGAKVIRVHPQMSNALLPIKVGATTLIELGIQ
jgi:uncharacterized LabA/DUF88 family protein